MVKRFFGVTFFCLLCCIGSIKALHQSFLAYQSEQTVEFNRRFIEQHPLLGEEDKHYLLGNFMLARLAVTSTALALSPDGVYFASSRETSPGNSLLLIANTSELGDYRERRLQECCIKDICFSHNNRYFAVAFADFSKHQNNRVLVWDTECFLGNPEQTAPVADFFIGMGEKVKMVLSSTGDYLAVSLSATPQTPGKIIFYFMRNMQKNWAKSHKYCSLPLSKDAECTGWSFTLNDHYLVANIAKKSGSYCLYFYDTEKIVKNFSWNIKLQNSYDDRLIIALAPCLEKASYVCPMSAGYFDKSIAVSSTSSQSSFFAFREDDSPYTWIYASFIKTFPHEYLKRLVDLYIDDRLTLDNHCAYDEKKLYETILNDALPTRLRKNNR